MIDIVANESGWFTLRGITISGDQIFYFLSIFATYYLTRLYYQKRTKRTKDEE